MLTRLKGHQGVTFFAQTKRRLVLLSLVLLSTHVASLRAQPNTAAQQQNRPEVTTLELGKPIERDLAGEQRHSYQITLAAGQYATAVLEQRGIDSAGRSARRLRE